MKRKVILIAVMTLILSVRGTAPVFSQVDVFTFTLAQSYLETMDPTIPLTYQATIENASSTLMVFGLSRGFSLLGNVWGTVTLEPGFPNFLNPGASWTGAFATFDFYDWLTPVKVQTIQFWVSGMSFGPGFNFEVEYKNASAGLVPEPASLLLLSSGLLGFAGYGGFRLRRRRKA